MALDPLLRVPAPPRDGLECRQGAAIATCGQPVARGRDREGAGFVQGGPVRRGAGHTAAARGGRSGAFGHPIPGRHGGARRIEEAGHRRGEAGGAVGRGHRRLPHHADRGPRPRPRPPGACPGFLPEGRGQAGHAAFRAGAGRQAAGVGGAQRQPVPVSDAGAKALERARGPGAGAGQQYLQPVGRADDRARHPHRTASVYLSGGGRARIRYRHLGLGRRGIPVPVGRTAGGCARAATSRAGTTARASSTK